MKKIDITAILSPDFRIYDGRCGKAGGKHQTSSVIHLTSYIIHLPSSIKVHLPSSLLHLTSRYICHIPSSINRTKYELNLRCNTSEMPRPLMPSAKQILNQSPIALMVWNNIKRLPMYSELIKNPPFSAWKDGLDE